MNDIKVKALVELLKEISSNELLINDACFHSYAYSKKFASSPHFDEIIRLKAKEALYISMGELEKAIKTKKTLRELLKGSRIINSKKIKEYSKN